MDAVDAWRAKLGARLCRLWRAATRPSSAVTDPSARWRARLLAGLMLAGLPLAIAACSLCLSLDGPIEPARLWIIAVPVVGMIISYTLARSRWWRAGAWLSVLLVSGTATADLAVRQDPLLAVFVGMAITLGGMVLRKRDTLLLVGLALLSFWTMPLWAGRGLGPLEMILVTSFFLALALVLGMSIGLREAIERRRLAALAKSEARHRSLLEVAFEGLVVLKDGRIVELNPGFTAICGRAESQLLGRELTAVLQLADDEHASVAEDSLITEPIRPGMFEATGQRPNGEIFHVELVTRSDETTLGPVEYVAVRDVTQRRRAAVQLSITHRAAALGTLAGGIAYEINNPLSWTLTNIQMAQDQLQRNFAGRRPLPEEDSVLHALEDSLQGGRQVMAIIKDLKTLSRRDAEVGTTDLQAALDLACRITARQIEGRARLVRDYGHVPSVRGNAAELGQVLISLLTNAVQAIPEGRREHNRITVRSRSRGGKVEVSVRDTGRGIPARDLPRVFDPFFTTRAKGEATGLGLSVSRSVVVGLGGTLEAESQEGQGATFTLTLPVVEAARDHDAPRPRVKFPARKSPSRPHRKASAPNRAASAPTRAASAPNRAASAPTRAASAPNRAASAPTRAASAPTRAATPLSPAPPPEHPPARAVTTGFSSPSRPAPRNAGPRVRILVIDDEPLLNKSVRRSLREHEVICTEEPERALVLCQETEFDVIICDLMMPVMSGEEFYERLKQHDAVQAEKILFMTGGAFPGGPQSFASRMPHPVLYKPFKPDDLRKAVQRVLEAQIGAA